MAVKNVDVSRSIYTIAGSNLAFDSNEVLLKYLCNKWGIRMDQIFSFESAAGNFESGADVTTFSINGREVKILNRRIVTEENLDGVIAAGW